MAGVTSKKLPVYRLHSPSGQARVRWLGREFYLGRFDSTESRERYAELLTKIVTGTILDDGAGSCTRADSSPRRSAKAVESTSDGISVNELCVAFLRHAQQHYRKGDKPTTEYDCFLSAIKPLKELFGTIPVNEFGPCSLKAVRQRMVENGWCRRYVNRSVTRIRQIFKFGVENEWIEPSTLQKLQAVPALLAGRTEAPDHAERQAVSQERIEAVRKIVATLYRDLIDLQLFTGARPGELLLLTSGMVDRSGDVWTATLTEHKTKHKGKGRKLAFGPKAQLILRRHLKADPDAKVFEVRRDSYGHAVRKACEVAFRMPDELRTIDKELPAAEQDELRRLASEWRRKHCWTPHWLRHNVATRVRDEFGIEHAQAVAGHASPSMTAHYASKLDVLAVQVAKSIG